MVAIGWTGGAVTGEVGTAVVAVSWIGSGTGGSVGVGSGDWPDPVDCDGSVGRTGSAGSVDRTGSVGFGVAPSLVGSVIARVSFGA
jgi:hypothetical protein